MNIEPSDLVELFCDDQFYLVIEVDQKSGDLKLTNFRTEEPKQVYFSDVCNCWADKQIQRTL